MVSDLVDRAWAQAAALARVSGVEIREAVSADEQTAARGIFDTTWPGEGSQVTSNLLRAMTHVGGYASIAVIDDDVIGAAFAFVGVRNGKLHLHSHMAGVIPTMRDRNIGRALKFHQRAWALSHGITDVAWTFDPLVRRNAKLNLIRLGAIVIDYEPDFYGEMADELNAGDRTDRLYAWWDLTASEVEAAGDGNLSARNSRELLEQGFVEVLRDHDGEPELFDSTAHACLVAIPSDIVDIRSSDPERSLRWRMAMRAALEPRLTSGWLIDGLTDRGEYVLVRGVAHAD